MTSRGGRSAGMILAAAGLTVALLVGKARAEADGPDFFRVTGVAAEDVLNIRDGAGAEHRKIGEIPPDGRGLRNLGCVGGLSYAEWAEATEAERAAAARTRWCRIEHDGVTGWVAARFLAEDTGPPPAAGSAWRIVAIDGRSVSPEAELVFRDGQVFGTVGCNRFRGQAEIAEDGRLATGPVAATLMACPEPSVAEQEDRLLGLLREGAGLAFDPFADRLTLSGADGAAAVVLERRAP